MKYAGDCDAKATSYAWVSPHGSVHRLGGGEDHLEWAFDYAREHHIPVDASYEASAHDTLLKLGWVKITNYANIESWDFGRPAQAWAAVAEVVAGCLRPDTVDEVVRVDTAPFGSEARKLSIGDFIERFGGRALAEKAFGKLNKTAASESLERAWFKSAKEFSSQEALNEYLKERPKADKKKHWVKDEKPTKSSPLPEKSVNTGTALVEKIKRPSGWRPSEDEGELTQETRKKWETSHTARTPGGSVVLGVTHMDDEDEGTGAMRHGDATHAASFKEHVLKEAVKAAKAAREADPPKKVVFLGEGGASVGQPYSEQDLADENAWSEQHAVAKALHAATGGKAEQDTWDTDDIALTNPESSTWGRLTEAAGGDKKKAAGALAVFMAGQGQSYKSLKSEGWVDAGTAKFVKEATGIDIRKKLTGEDEAKLKRMAFPGDYGDPHNEVSAIGEVFNATRQANLLKKMKDIEAEGGVCIVTPGASHAYQLKHVLEGGSKKSKGKSAALTRYLERAWFSPDISKTATDACNPIHTSFAWIDPHGKVHDVYTSSHSRMGIGSHPMFAVYELFARYPNQVHESVRDYASADAFYTAMKLYEEGATDEDWFSNLEATNLVQIEAMLTLAKLGWVKVSNAYAVGFSMSAPGDAALDAYVDILTACLRSKRRDPDSTPVHYEVMGTPKWGEMTATEFIEKFASRKRSDEFYGSYLTGHKKSAMTIAEIRSNTSPEVLAKGSKVKLSLKRADPARGIWTYTASGSEGASYTVRVKALPAEGNRKNTTDVGKLDVLVSCSCPFFQYQGPEHWARVNDFLYGKPRGTAATPTEKDPSGKNWVCKHAARALDMLGLARLDGPK